MMKVMSKENERMAKRNDIRIERHIFAACCEHRFVADKEYEVWDLLLKHVEVSHPDFYKGIDHEARRMARGCNGAGYWDSDEDNGWSKAGPDFKHSYRRRALQLAVQGHCFP